MTEAKAEQAGVNAKIADLQVRRHALPVIDTAPPKRSKITGGLAALPCAACCAIPLLITAGVLTGAGAAVLERTLLAISAGLAVAALGMWRPHRRRQRQRTAAGGGTCGCGGCSS